MKSVSTRLDDETEEEIRERAEVRDVSIAEILRELIEKGLEHDRLKAENDRLKNEKRQILDQQQEHQALVTYAEEEREKQQQERIRRNSPIWKKVYWTAFGRGDQNIFSDDDEENR